MKPKCLFVGDGCVATGFARMNHAYLDGIRQNWDVHMVALNYDGDPHPYPYKVYHPIPRMGGDRFGVSKTAELYAKIQPDVVVLVNDPWNVPAYLRHVGTTPVIGSIAVDGLNCRGEMLNGLSHAIFWTEFGAEQARLGGYVGPASTIPLGVDLAVYLPTAQEEARRRCGLPVSLRGSDTFIVGVVGRNQPRKRIDLAMMYFSEWIKRHRVENAYLMLHIGPTGDSGYDVGQLAGFLGIEDKVIVSSPDIGHGLPEEKLKYIYGCFDVMLSTTQGEGWGLTHMEGMACGIPQILPDWAALGEWAKPAAKLVRCSTFACTPANINAIGGIMDGADAVAALQTLYVSEFERMRLRQRGLNLVAEPQYRWEHIGQAFSQVLDAVAAEKKEPVLV